MENNNLTTAEAQAPKQLELATTGGDYFGIWILNAILTVFTLGIYYPWAKTRERQFFANSTYLGDSSFEYHGTGMELFIGFLKAIGVFLIPYLLLGAAQFTQNTALILVSSLLFMIFLFSIIPLAIHGSLKYRTSRVSWRGIFFGYSGDRKELVKLFIKNVLLTVVTFGIYGSWAQVHIRKYIIERLHFGNIRATYKGNGGDLFLINLFGTILIFITIGIYAFWYARNIFRFHVENTVLEQDGREIGLTSTVTPGGIFVLMLTNILLIIFTIGIATPWVVVRTLKFYFEHVEIDGSLQLEAIHQGDVENFKNATGDDMLDMLDMG